MKRLAVVAVTLTMLAAATPARAAFTRQTVMKVGVLASGDAGAALNQVILTKNSPIGDAFYGLDNTFLSRALGAGIFQPYQSTQLASVPATYQLDAQHRVTPIDHGDVCINYDKTWFSWHQIPVPTSLDDLTKPAYKG